MNFLTLTSLQNFQYRKDQQLLLTHWFADYYVNQFLLKIQFNGLSLLLLSTKLTIQVPYLSISFSLSQLKWLRSILVIVAGF